MSFSSNMFYEEKRKYEIIVVARPVFTAILPKINRQTFRKDGHVSRMIKGIFKLLPTLPKYVVTYEPDIISQCMDSLPANNLLSMDLFTKKNMYFAFFAE